MNKSILQGFFSLLLVSSFFINPLLSFAQQATTTPGTEESSPFSALQETSLDVTINKVTAGSGHSVAFDLSLNNESGLFLDGLRYSLEFYKGDALLREGNIFASTTRITVISGDIPRLAPYKEVGHVLNVEYPKDIPAGNYFFRLSITNEADNVWGFAYTENPVSLKGDGTMLAMPVGYVRVSDNGGEYINTQHYFVSPSSSLSLILPLSGGALTSNIPYRDQASKLSVVASVHPFNDIDTTVHAFAPQSFAVSSTELQAAFSSWAGIKPGLYKLMVDIQNQSGVSVLSHKIPVYWSVEGFFADVVDIETATNKYLKNDAVDLKVKLEARGGDVATPVSVKAVLADSKGRTQGFEKNIQIGPASELGEGRVSGIYEISFEDEMMSDDFNPASIKIAVTRADTGEVVSEETKTLDATPSAPSFKFVGIILLILVLVGLAALLIVRKSFNGAVRAIIVIAIIVVALILGFRTLTASADDIAYKNFDTNESASINYSKAPTGNQGTCSQDAPVAFTVRALCDGGGQYKVNVRLYVDNNAKINNTYYANRNAGDNECKISNGGCSLDERIDSGTIGYDLNLNENDRNKNYYVEIIASDGPCNFTAGTNQKSASCEISSGGGGGGDRVNGNCGSQASAPSQTVVNNRGACDAGNFQNISDTDTKIKWNCNGINGGSDASCSANRSSTPTATCGATANTCASNSTPSTECTDWYTIKKCSGGDWRTTCGNYQCANGQNSQSDSPTCTSSYVERKCASGNWAKTCNNYKCANGENSGAGKGCNGKGGFVYGDTVCENWVTNNDCSGQGGYVTRQSCADNWVSSYSNSISTRETYHSWKCTPGNDSRTTYYDENSDSVRNTSGVESCNLVSKNGICGTTVNACSNGTLQNTTDSATNYLWNCIGTNGGTNASCSIAMPRCGSINGTTTTWPSPASASTWCAAGTQSAWTQRGDTALNGAEWEWNCESASGGTSVACSFVQQCTGTQTLVDGVCTNNRAPDAPRVTGPSEGDPNIYHDFEAVSIDADNDDITYGFDWNNDGTVDEWSPGITSYLDSSVATEADYSWSTLGTKTFRVRAKDIHGALSTWTAKTIDITNECRSVRIDYSLNPSIVRTRSETCSLSWGASNIDENGNGAACARPVTCTLDGTAVASSSAGTSINVGNHTLVCTDGVDFTTTQNVKCQLNPSFGEF